LTPAWLTTDKFYKPKVTLTQISKTENRQKLQAYEAASIYS
jgi:hypothetical protein